MNSKLLRKIHIYLSLICFSFLFFFCFTAITLNHPSLLTKKPSVHQRQLSISEPTAQFYNDALARNGIVLSQSQQALLIASSELTIANPGQRTDLYIDNQNNIIEIIDTNFGWIATLNELHQNRHTPAFWTVISDVIAGILMLICISGTWLSLKHKAHRKRYLYLLTASSIALLTMV